MVALPLAFYLSGITWSTQFEESVGFRYFHSIRLLYGEEYPFVPQGHLTGLIHFLIQHTLTFFGYPINQLFPRVDIFCLWAVLIPLLIAAACFYWAIIEIRSLLVKYFFSVLFLCSFFSPHFQDGWMLLPDYHIGMVSLALIACGWCFRILSPNQTYFELSNRVAILLGIYAGACAGIKITLATYPLLLSLVFLVLNKNLKTIFRLCCLSAPIALLTWLLILYIYFTGNIGMVLKYFDFIHAYTTSEVSGFQKNFINFLSILKPLAILDTFVLIPVAIVFSLYASIRKNITSVASIIAPILLLELYLIYNRNYSHSYIELQFILFISLSLLGYNAYQDNHKILYKYSLPLNSRIKRFLLGSLIVMLTAYPIAHFTNYHLERISGFKSWINSFNTGYGGIQKSLEEHSGNTVFLIPADNSIERYNLHSIDNGLYKALFHDQDNWSKDIYLAKLFHDRWYATNEASLPNFDHYQNLVFRTGANETISEALLRLNKFFHTDFSVFKCGNPYFNYKMLSDETIVFCSK